MVRMGCVMIGFMLVCMTATPAVGQGADAATGPKVYLPMQQHDFPLVVEGVDVVHDFVVKNVGSADLLIQRVKAD